ncbi:hypothetical protein, partial [Pluralibacter gergoviae]|uniref:hypothetical protein n=2 Tax=Pluralibacter gergoviae TaxID=61647 RepID=UPI002FD9E164
MGISDLCYSTVLGENVMRLTPDCENARKLIWLHAFSAVKQGVDILPLTPGEGIHIMPPVNTTRFTLRGYSSAGRAPAWHAGGQR